MKNIWIYGVALAVVMGSTVALANGPKFGGTDYEQTQGQGQLQGQEANANAGAVGIGVGKGGDATAVGLGGKSDQSQSSKNTNRNTNNVGAASGSISGATGGAGGQGGTSVAGSYSEGSVSKSSSRTGDSRSASGAVSGGNETVQGVAVDASDNSITDISYNNDYPVSQAASLFTQVCQQGVSGQGDDWGASAVFSDALCDEIKVAQFYWIAHINEHNHGNDEQAAEFKTMYVAQMADIQKMMDATDELGIIDRISGFLLKPLGVAALLVFLL